MFGDPKQLLLLGCINNRVDRPSPELDRSKGLHGHQTPGGVFHVNNDTDASKIETYPHGVVEHISAKGDRITQTRDGARIQLKQDGTVQTENNNSSTTLNPDGTVLTRNAKGGAALLSNSGEWLMKSSSTATLKLASAKAELGGPASSLSGLLQGVQQSVPGSLGDIDKAFTQVSNLIKQFQSGGNALAILNKIKPLLGNLQGAIEKLPTGIDSLNQITSQNSINQLGTALMGQAERFMTNGLATVVPIISKIVNEVSPEKLKDALIKAVPQLAKVDLSPLALLSYNPDLQIQYLTGALAPDGFESVQNIIGTGLHTNMQDLYTSFNEIQQNIPTWFNTLVPPNYLTQPPGWGANLPANWTGGDSTAIAGEGILPISWQNENLTLEQQTEWQSFLSTSSKKISQFLPAELAKSIDSNTAVQLVEALLVGKDPLPIILGTHANTTINNASTGLTNLTNQNQTVNLLSNLATGISQGIDITGINQSLTKTFPTIPPPSVNNSLDDTMTRFLPSIMKILAKDIKDTTTNVNKIVQQLFQTLNSKSKTGALQIGKDLIQAYSNAESIGAFLKITNSKASLVGAGSGGFGGLLATAALAGATGGASLAVSGGGAGLGASAAASLLGGSGDLGGLGGMMQGLSGATELFAQEGTAGIKTPHGGIGFGAGGGAMTMIGQMVQQAVNNSSSTDGSRFLLDGGNAILQYGGLGRSGDYDYQHQLKVNKDGVFVNDINLTTIWDGIYSRFSRLEAAIANLAPTP